MGRNFEKEIVTAKNVALHRGEVEFEIAAIVERGIVAVSEHVSVQQVLGIVLQRRKALAPDRPKTYYQECHEHAPPHRQRLRFGSNHLPDASKFVTIGQVNGMMGIATVSASRARRRVLSGQLS